MKGAIVSIFPAKHVSFIYGHDSKQCLNIQQTKMKTQLKRKLYTNLS